MVGAQNKGIHACHLAVLVADYDVKPLLQTSMVLISSRHLAFEESDQLFIRKTRESANSPTEKWKSDI